MTSDSLLFGDVFLYGNEEFVYLAATTDQLYAAKILDKELTKEIDKCCQKAVVRNRDNFIRMPLYCYVILTTEEVQDRMANFSKTDGCGFDKVIRKLPFTLNDADKRDIYKEISKSQLVPLKLRELLEDIPLQI